MHFLRFSARRTVDLKARRVAVNQGLDHDLRLDILVIAGAGAIAIACLFIKHI